MNPTLAAMGSLCLVLIALWAVSVKVRDSSLIDLYWGPAFAQVAGVTAALGPAIGPRAWLLLVLTSIWGIRLGAYLAWRNLGHGEDARYTAMRARHGEAWAWRSLFLVFFLQGALVLIVSLPTRLALQAASSAELGPLDLLGAALWSTGLFFEAVGDSQLARFKADPASKGQVMDRGQWRYTRHPNYFGDFCIAWGLFAIALAGGAPAWTAIGPAVMSFLLVRVSGVRLLESTIGARRPGYAAYVARTNAFFPGPPRSTPGPSQLAG